MEKAFLRKEFLRKRDSAKPQWLIEQNALILSKLERFVQENHFKTLHTFLSQLNSREVHTYLAVELFRVSFPALRIAAPYIVPGTRKLEHFLLTPDTHLIVNQWKIPEPDPLTSEKILPEEIDIVIVPLLAFDYRGYRVGYGGGYYDRFLAQTRPDCVKVGLSIFEAIEKITDIDEFDLRLDFCITPDHIHKF